jgi:flagellar basal-body rod modification protein FlgD
MSPTTSATNPANWGNINDLLQGDSAQKAEAAGTDRLANKEVFLQLLVAQLKHQNPLSPENGVEFVAQLAQFTQLEQTFGMRDDLKAIRESVSSPIPPAETQQP